MLSIIFRLVLIIGPFLSALTACGDDTMDADVNVDCRTVIAQSPAEYGIQTWWADQDSSIFAAGWTELGANTVRVPLIQGLYEPVNDDGDPNHINWSGFNFDDAILWPLAPGKTISSRKWYNAIRDNRLTVIVCPFYIAGWNSHVDRTIASPYPPKSLTEHKEFLYAFLHWLVKKVNFPPEKIILEAMNEPDWPQLGFWENWNINDIENVCRVSRKAADAVDARIRVIGPTECKGVRLAQKLMLNHNGAAYLDGLSYHYYGDNFNTAISRAKSLKVYDLPIYLTEYGNLSSHSTGVDGALWHSTSLSLLWKAGGIRPIQYPMTNFPTGQPDQDNIRKMALQLDWREGWQKKAAWWVYANFWHRLSGAQVIQATANRNLEVIAGKKIDNTGKEKVVIWLTNTRTTTYQPVRFQVLTFSNAHATVRVYDNLRGNLSIDSFALSNLPLAFEYSIPARSSYSFVLTTRSPFPIKLSKFPSS